MSELWLFSALAWLFLLSLFVGLASAFFEWIKYRRLEPLARVDYERDTSPETLVAGSLVGLITIGMFGRALYGM